MAIRIFLIPSNDSLAKASLPGQEASYKISTLKQSGQWSVFRPHVKHLCHTNRPIATNGASKEEGFLLKK
jgi:hypothetical protein